MKNVRFLAAAAILIPMLGSSPGIGAQLAAMEQAPSASTWPTIADTAKAGPHRFERAHEGTFNGRLIRYRSVLEETILSDPKGTPASSMYSTSFIVRGGLASARRPVIFVFNGGPGGASNMLMFGAFGPKRIADMSTAGMANPSVAIIDNAYAPLDVADIVIVDAPETGFGRPLDGTDPKIFRSIDGDSYAVGQFILHWLSSNGRQGSPVYLAGESYGGHRAVALARDLRVATPKVEVAGLILISQALGYNGPTATGTIPRLPDALRGIGRIQDAAGIAWYHGKIDNRSQTLPQAIERAGKFARTEYANALLLGNRLDDATRRRVATRLAELTGIPAEIYLANGLRLPNVRTEMFRAEGRNLDQFDGRETEPAATAKPDRDRDWDAVTAGLTSAMERYAASDLGASGLPKYRTVVPDPYGFEDSWGYLKPPSPGLDLVLSQQLRAQPHMRVMVPMGVFDTTSSVGSAQLLFAQMDAPAGQVTLAYYPGGHALYTSLDGLEAFNRDVRAFVTGKDPVSTQIPDIKPKL
ncbi:MAG: hypothetical protein QM605_14375 [Sphingobium sp.]